MSTEAQFTDNNIPTNPALLIGGWEVVIGLEIHAQLTTQSKLFSGSAIAYGAAPNTQASEVDLALPGVLPVLNKQVLEMAAKLGIALEAHMGEFSVFDRKNYFYPDLPQGYQISQLDYPVVGLGHLDVTLDDGTVKRVGVTRAHLEQDAGKSLHEDYAGMTGIDLNRAGTPLLEIVSEPDLRSSKEAVAYMKKMHELVQYLGICDGNMQEGSFRCDANVSVRQPGDVFGTRAELKNINSFKNIEKAIDFEINRQIDLLESGQSVVQETRLYDPDQNVTRSMRSKEEANDYRYFPDPDLLPVAMPREFIEQVRKTMPEMADSKRARYINEYQLSEYDADLLSGDRLQAEYFEQLLSEGVDAKQAANWMMGELASALNEAEMNISEAKVSPAQLAQLIARISDDTISGKIAKQVFAKMWQTGNAADNIIESEGLKQITDTGAIEAIIDQVIADNPEQVEQYRGGAEKVLGFFVGQVMKASQGKANPGQVNQMLKQKLT